MRIKGVNFAVLRIEILDYLETKKIEPRIIDTPERALMVFHALKPYWVYNFAEHEDITIALRKIFKIPA